jgi:hypothetical protein
MTHFGEFSNSGQNLSNFHFLKQNLDPVFIFKTFFVKKIMHVRAYAKNICKGSRLSAAVFRCGSDRDEVGGRTFTPQLVLVFIYSIFNNVLFLTSN